MGEANDVATVMAIMVVMADKIWCLQIITCHQELNICTKLPTQLEFRSRSLRLSAFKPTHTYMGCAGAMDTAKVNA